MGATYLGGLPWGGCRYPGTSWEFCCVQKGFLLCLKACESEWKQGAKGVVCAPGSLGDAAAMHSSSLPEFLPPATVSRRHFHLSRKSSRLRGPRELLPTIFFTSKKQYTSSQRVSVDFSPPLVVSTRLANAPWSLLQDLTSLCAPPFHQRDAARSRTTHLVGSAQSRLDITAIHHEAWKARRGGCWRRRHQSANSVSPVHPPGRVAQLCVHARSPSRHITGTHHPLQAAQQRSTECARDARVVSPD